MTPLCGNQISDFRFRIFGNFSHVHRRLFIPCCRQAGKLTRLSVFADNYHLGSIDSVAKEFG